MCEADHVATKLLIDATNVLRAGSNGLIDATNVLSSVTKALCDEREADHVATKLQIDATKVHCDECEAARATKYRTEPSPGIAKAISRCVLASTYSRVIPPSSVDWAVASGHAPRTAR